MLRIAVTEGETGFGRLDLGGGQTINVEFVSANPTGPLHAGHGRWAAYGDSLARVLERCGYDPHREFYLNDRGVQMERFAASLAARKRGEEPPEDGYLGAYISEWAAEMPDDADPLEWGLRAGASSTSATRLALDGSACSTPGSPSARWSRPVRSRPPSPTSAPRAHVYDADGAVWLRTTDFGDDKDRVLVKSDGESTYLLPDIAYHRDKFARGFDLLIDVLGRRPPRLRAAHEGRRCRRSATTPTSSRSSSASSSSCMRAGEEVQLSKRTGDIVELRDVIDEVGPDATRLTYLLQSIDTQQTFDLDVVTQRVDGQPGLLRADGARPDPLDHRATAAERGVRARAARPTPTSSLLMHERELDCCASLVELPDVVDAGVRRRGPRTRSRPGCASWPGAFHGFYHDCYVIGDGVSPELTQARLWLVEAARVGPRRRALDLLGVSRAGVDVSP